ncbi:bifunctional hydroxymethylpyrimidine kinase/phosphomethylpyrimidine kinase [Saccharothrix sp. 6-C]|uniref:PfkB family carbohydrate kinase n=1 Tax=Saccharothrix sp. 6-C TaxID=2781735 RepID=UPI0019177CEB|nr:PfkB family carbohydrate kinase [Saccharothrix sp. 6-C]QQQ78607.1 bifunctional hydroxymethylpyrimidine kinase/phosphomethylpyrimidine kinase [Saccharothrix sp. 6-C]
MRIAVVGQIARDLVLVVPEVPGPGARAGVLERREMLGGKGANIARGTRQLGATAALVGVVGDDREGRLLVERLDADGVATSAVVCRAGVRTALMVDLVCDGAYRYLEDVPEPTLVTVDDVRAAASTLAGADAVVVQLQQPAEAALAAVRAATGLVVLDGAPAGREAELLAAADVVRADHHEAELVTGRSITGADAAVRAGRELLARGPSVVALEVPGEANVLTWAEGSVVVPLTEEEVVDTTGGGDAFVAALTVALVRGDDPADAGRLATAAAGRAVGHPGGRTDLTGLALAARQLG